MSTFGRTTRSSTNLGLGRTNVNNLLKNKPVALGNLNGGKNQQLAGKQPLKRAALSSTTNLLNKNVLNDKAGNLNELKNGKQTLKVSQPRMRSTNNHKRQLQQTKVWAI